MIGRLQGSWNQVRNSLWFLPAVLTLASGVLATLTVQLDRHGIASPDWSWFILVSGAEGARGVLSTIAGSIITVTGVVFSITIVVLQLASSQFSPRVLRSFTEDRVNQLVLGVFIGTFTYALLVLRTVRSELDDYSRFVPSLSVNVAVLLALISIGFLIYFVNHIARSIQAETIIARVTADALEVIDKLFPEELGEGARESAAASEHETATPTAIARSESSGFLQHVDGQALMDFAEKNDVVLRMEHGIGDFVIKGDALIAVVGGNSRDVKLNDIRGAAQIGAERTRTQDVERGLIELTDVAVRALSPGINDPTTALVCIHRLTEVFAALGARRFPPRARLGSDGSIRVIAPRSEFHELVALAYGQITEHGRRLPTIMHALIESLERLKRILPLERHQVLSMEVEKIRAAAGQTNE